MFRFESGVEKTFKKVSSEAILPAYYLSVLVTRLTGNAEVPVLEALPKLKGDVNKLLNESMKDEMMSMMDKALRMASQKRKMVADGERPAKVLEMLQSLVPGKSAEIVQHLTSWGEEQLSKQEALEKEHSLKKASSAKLSSSRSVRDGWASAALPDSFKPLALEIAKEKVSTERWHSSHQ